MDVEATKDVGRHEQAAPGRGRAARWLLVALNCGMLVVGTTGGPLISRLYFSKGGHRQWLSAWLQTAGWPLLLVPVAASYLSRRARHSGAPLFLTPRRVLLAGVGLGFLNGADDFIYAYGLAYLPVSTSAILISTQLAFTVFFACLIVRQRLTAATLNAVALLTIGAVVLGLHASKDRPAGVTSGKYWMGFFLTLGAAALYGLILPLVELAYKHAAGGGRTVTYALVMEMQLVMGFFATAFCTVGMVVNKDFQAIPREAKQYELGEARYYVVLVFNAILWEFFFVGAVGVIFCVHTLLAGIIIAVFIPITEVLGVIFLHEKFSSEKGVALLLSLWGLASYSYGEYADAKAKKKAALEAEEASLELSLIMEVEAAATQRQPCKNGSTTKQQQPSAGRSFRNPLLVVNFVLMVVGSACGPLLLRAYFLRGGNRKWLSSLLQTAGWPLLLVPLWFSYYSRRRREVEDGGGAAATPLFLMTPRLLVASAVVGLMTGVDDLLYAYGLAYLPVSTSSILISTQLAFTAAFALLLVRQRFTAFSVNAVVLLSVGAAMLGMNAGGDRPAGVSRAQYCAGFAMTLGAAALYGLVLPVMELSQARHAAARGTVTYTLVMEMQLVIGFVATAFSAIGMLVNNDFHAIPGEAQEFGLGQAGYYLLLAGSAAMYQCFFLGTIGAIFYGSALLAGVIMTVLIPVTEVLAVMFFHEPFNGTKGVALALSLWGFVSYFYGEVRAAKAAAHRRHSDEPPKPDHLDP
uniref:EamA domain-containing protein n=1 Tax=Oryza punctata TaxID=4537 RepID=A0A0E0M278_ORYPU